MKLPISWLRYWIELDATPDAIAEALTTRGFYVEGVEQHGRAYPGIVVARVLEANKHPNADKLKLCRVDAGGVELKIVCGAPNVTAGMTVPLATLGTVMPNGLEIKRAKIRGEESEGMLCSARELMLSEDHSGILELTELFAGQALTIGAPVDTYFPKPDAVLEVEVPFNRPDGMGVIGLAREVKAALGGDWTARGKALLAARAEGAPGSGGASAAFDLSIADAEGCPSYLAQVVEGVTVAPSPEWLVTALAAMGQRTINNIVDITNLVLFEFGQPLHAFDLAKLEGPAIRVRRASAGEKITTLDGKERELTEAMLVIADAKRAVAIAGVMGGANSEVGEGTRDILLECAWFQPALVRRGSKALALSTDASKRYERGVDPGIGPAAAARFLGLLLELCPGAKLGASKRIHSAPAPLVLPLRPSRCSRLIGLPFTAERCEELLRRLEFAVERNGDALAATVPSWRLDCTLEDDLVEEVARSNGYDRIPEAPIHTGGAFATRSPRERVVRRAREAMMARGFTEAWCPTLVSEAEALACAPLLGDEPNLLRLLNPMSRETEVMRPNLLPGLLRSCAHNLRQGASAVRLFEVGAGILPRGEKLPEERLMIAALVTGGRWRHTHDAPATAPAHAYDARGMVDFLDAKGLWEAWLSEMRVDSPQWRAYAAAGWKPGASAEVAVESSRIGWAGTLGQALLRQWEIEVPVHVFVALLDPLTEAASRTTRARMPGRFPSVRRDLAFFVPRAVTQAQVQGSLAAVAGETLSSIELFDVYEGPGTPQGMKSLAYALEFQHVERTLAENEVQQLQARMVAAVARDCGGQLRER
ncbi:MAG: phenylalanine--tRNA ligase subunit beta [Candidatus Eisenbacteria bacterium]|nr:phenylalanine--tRNA ligase subunit beta [Candidatus Eisenbacteria bacterium]